MIRLDRIEERMAALGLNPTSTAKLAGFGADYVRDLFRGRVKDPGAWRLRQLAEVLACDPDYLLGLADAPGAPPVLQSKGSMRSLRIRHDLKGGFHDVDEENRWESKVQMYDVPSLAPEGTAEWLELVIAPQMDGRVPTGAILHVLPYDPAKAYAGLVVMTEYRDDDRLARRTLRQLQGDSDRAAILPGPNLTGIQVPQLVKDGRARNEILRMNFVLNGIVPRAYLMFDGTSPVDVIA